MSDNRVRDDLITALPWLVGRGSGNGAAGRPFPTIPAPSVQEKAKELPHARPALPELPHAEEAPASLPRNDAGRGFKGGEEEC